MRRSPAGPAATTTASSAANGTHRSEGCTATQCSEASNSALYRPNPSVAEQPVPGSRLLHGVVTS